MIIKVRVGMEKAASYCFYQGQCCLVVRLAPLSMPTSSESMGFGKADSSWSLFCLCYLVTSDRLLN